MDYKLIITDIDDTLLDDNHKLSKENYDKIQQAKDKGVSIVLASGRPEKSMFSIAEQLNINNGYLVSYNGAKIIDLSNKKTIYENSLSKEDIHEMYDESKKHNVKMIAYNENNIISDQEYKYITFEKEITGLNLKIVKDFKKEIDYSSIKCMFLEEPDYLKTVYENLSKKYKDKYNLVISKPYFLEVLKKGVSKGSALEYICDILKINIENTIAVGDSFNDEDMIQKAGLGIVVENGREELKKNADYISSSNNDSALAHIIDKFIL